MKAIGTKKWFDSAVRGSTEAIFEATKEETQQLFEALRVVEKWKLAARRALKHDEKDADWTTYHYFVKSGMVHVQVDSGACG